MTPHEALRDAILALHGEARLALVFDTDVTALITALAARGYALTPIMPLWSTTQAAEYLGIDPGSVRKKLTRAGISRETGGWPADTIQQRWPTEPTCTCEPGPMSEHHDYCETSHPHHPCHAETCAYAE